MYVNEILMTIRSSKKMKSAIIKANRYKYSINALNKPIHASSLITLQMVHIIFISVFIGSNIFGISDIFGAFVISYLMTGITTHYMLKKVVNQEEDL